MFITHPEHGAHNITESEWPEHEKRGWKQSTHEEWLSSKKPRDDLDDLRSKWAEKYGKPPHHKKSAETLRAELA